MRNGSLPDQRTADKYFIMLLNEILTQAETKDGKTILKPWMDSHMNWPAGAHRQELHPSKEDADDPAIAAFVSKIKDVPIAAAYLLPQSPKVGFDPKTNLKVTQDDVDRVAQLKDAIKMRSPLYIMDEGDIRQIAKASIEKIVALKNTSPAVRGMQDRTLALVFRVQKALKSGNAVLVPIASSSKLASMIAHEASSKLGIPVIEGLEKRVGEISKHYWTKDRGYEPRPNFSNPVQQKLNTLKQTVTQLRSSGAPRDQISQAETELSDYMQKAMRQSTKGVGMVDHRRGIYGTQEAVNEELLNLEGKDVIFVDDNVYQGLTVQEAALALARLGIIPNSVSGIVIHKLY